MSHNTEHVSAQANRIVVEAVDLPLHCPMPKSPLWCEHPRVFLNFDASGLAKCPYCSAEYQLAEGVSAPSAH